MEQTNSSTRAVWGHEAILCKLKQACDRDELSHAYLFEGAKGIGRYTAAMHLIMYAFCKSGQKRPCGACAACRKALNGNHEHIYSLQPDGNSIKDEQAEEMQRFLLKKSYDEERTFIIIDGAGSMTPRAQNRILKTLEEPPGKVTFILLAENVQSLAITILSRCVLISFKPLARREIMEFLSQKGINGQESETIAALSFGLPGRAVSLLATEELGARRKAAAAIVFGLLAARPYYQCSAELARWTGDKQDALELLNMMQGMLRDVLLLQAGADKELITNVDYYAQLLQASAKSKRRRIIALIRGAETARNDIALHININYAIKNMMLCE